MCGISGVLSNNPDSRSCISEMLNRMAFRGPDETQIYSDNFFSAGMVRLSINDLTSGSQPFISSDGRYSLFYNGEIYNYALLKHSLLGKGYSFRGHSDGEVILPLFMEKGNQAFDLLDGMFAISIWDSHREELLLVRDHSGEKPLYYCSSGSSNEFAFSSYIPSLLALPFVSKTINLDSLWDFPTFLWIPEPSTIYKDIQSVPPGYLLRVSSTSSHSLFSFQSDQGNSSCESLSQEELRCTVDSVVKSRLLADVPVGGFLSGGLDSSIIASVASTQIDDYRTYTVAFGSSADPYHGNSDESYDAAQFASYLNTNHTTINVDSLSFLNRLDQLTIASGQPYAVSSALGILEVSSQARADGVKVLLSGDGADEVFGGYSWYRYFSRLTRHTFDRTCLKQKRLLTKNPAILTQRLNDIELMPNSLQAYSLHYYASEAEKSSLFHPDIEHDSSLRHFDVIQANDVLRFMHHDRTFYFRNEMLSKLDRMTMFCSVEGRAPFAAKSIQSLSSRLRYEDLITSKQLKVLLRNSYRAILPSSILDRPKHGFNVPIDQWLQGPWKHLLEDTFGPDSLLNSYNLLHPKALECAKRMLINKTEISGHTIFCFIMLENWLRLSEQW